MAGQPAMDCAVVGAGPAGLAVSAALAVRGVDHVVLERGQAGETWRTQRWNSFRLNTPGWMNQMLGGQARDAFAAGAEVVQRLEGLAADRPVRSGTHVAGLPAGRLPWRHRGRDSLEWLVDAGFYDQRPQDLPDPSMINAAQPIVAAGGRSLSLPSLTRSGATLVGRPLSMTGDSLLLDDSVEANVTAGDVFAARVRTIVDEFIRQRGLDAPPSDPDDTDTPVDLNPPTALNLRDEDINSVIWCTGFTGDFSWLIPELLDVTGQPRRDGATGRSPGLWYVGLRWLTRRRSGLLFGFPDDAETIAAAVKAHLDEVAHHH